MKSKTIVLALLVYVAAVSGSFANSFSGTWKLNEGKSRIGHGAPKNSTVVYSWAPVFRTKITVDGKDAKGKALHTEWVGNFDGQDYAVTGDPASDMRSYKEVNDRTLEMTVKKNGKVVGTGRVAVAADGKTRTVTTMGRDAKGRRTRSVAVYDKA